MNRRTTLRGTTQMFTNFMKMLRKLQSETNSKKSMNTKLLGKPEKQKEGKNALLTRKKR